MTAKPSSSLRWAGIRMGILYPLLHGPFLQMMSPVHGDSAHIWNILASLILHVNMQDQWGTNSDLTTSGWTKKKITWEQQTGRLRHHLCWRCSYSITAAVPSGRLCLYLYEAEHRLLFQDLLDECVLPVCKCARRPAWWTQYSVRHWHPINTSL